MMTSNLPAGSCAPAPGRARAIKISEASARRSFITDVYYLKRLLSRRKFEADAFAAPMIQKCLGNRRNPTDPVLIRIGLINPNDAITRLRPVAFTDRNVGAKA